MGSGNLLIKIIIRIAAGIVILSIFMFAGSAYPPAAILNINGIEQTSGIGDNCWKEENQNFSLCSDTFDKITPTESLLSGSPFTAHLLLPLRESPEEVSFIATQVTDDNEFKSGTNDARVWRFEYMGNWRRLPSERESESDINLSLAPGLYVLNVFVKWKEKGEVLYVFLVQVNDPEAKITNKVGEKTAGFEFFSAITILLLVITIRRNRIK